MTGVPFGAFLNALGILVGALAGLVHRSPMPLPAQLLLRRALGAFTVLLGFRLVWIGINGTFWACGKKLLLALAAVTLGHAIGKLLRLQKLSNRLGRAASDIINAAQTHETRPVKNGFCTCTILFCAAPLGILGAVTGGLTGDYWLLAVKMVMDGLAMTGFVRLFGWPAALSAFSVYAFLGTITFLCQTYAHPFLAPQELVDSVNAAAGLIACAVALVVFGVRRVELANFLPALVLAPILDHFLGYSG